MLASLGVIAVMIAVAAGFVGGFTDAAVPVVGLMIILTIIGAVMVLDR